MEKLHAGKSIEDIVYDHSDMLIRLAFQNTRSMTEAEDIVQETYIKLIKHSRQFDSEDHLKAWLIRVTLNKCKDFFRTAWFRKTVQMDEGMEVFSSEERAVMEEIFHLKPEDRSIICLYYYEGYAIREIADMLGKSQNTISSRLQRARKKLKGIIEEGRFHYERAL